MRIGDEQILWNKIIKEVEAQRYLGPYSESDQNFHEQFDYFYQNPLGLVPKGPAKDLEDENEGLNLENNEIWKNPKNCRVVFHLSYKFDENGSVNSQTPRESCQVEYQGIDQAVQQAVKFACPFAAKTDGVAAFSQIPVRRQDWNLLVMKAKNPNDGKWYFFMSKVLGFGHSISCRIFSDFMAAVVHVVGRTCPQGEPIFYLDDAICIAGSSQESDNQLDTYIRVCDEINYPLSEEKTIRSTPTIVFLGMFLDLVNRLVSIPLEKKSKAVRKIEDILARKKIRMHKLQKLTGLLHFLGRAIVPGRAFTRRLYYKTAGLMQHHHLKVDKDIRDDLTLWLKFLQSEHAYRRPFMDFGPVLQADEINLYSDASKLHGWGCCFKEFWAFGAWNEEEKARVDQGQCSIQVQELLAFAVAVELLAPMLQNRRVVTFYDNQAVVAMINNASSKCRVCMELIRIITLTSMKNNCRFFSKWVSTVDNGTADALSRLDLPRFCKIAKNMNPDPMSPPKNLCPMKQEWWEH